MSQSRRRAAAAKHAQDPERAPEDSRISWLRARLLALPRHFEDAAGVIRSTKLTDETDS